MPHVISLPLFSLYHIVMTENVKHFVEEMHKCRNLWPMLILSTMPDLLQPNSLKENKDGCRQ